MICVYTVEIKYC